ncbi:MAG: short-chain dehydrogenase [Acidimicrobiia bacterium]|nr:MAG: short-chain dehydrogenase [Acidimicrobiia bacterium]
MADDRGVLVVGGSSGLGKALARHYAEKGRRVIVTSRSRERAEQAAADIGGNTTGIALDLTEPETIGDALRDVGTIDRLALVAVHRDENFVENYNIEGAKKLVTMKLVGYTEVIHSVLPDLPEDASIVLFGGLAKERPYPGSTTVTTVNGGVTGMVRTLALQLAPRRVNAIHPSIIGDSPYWADKPAEVLERFRARTPTGRLVTTAEVVDAAVFLLENTGMNGFDLFIDGGWLLT